MSEQQNFAINLGTAGIQPSRKEAPHQHARVLTHVNPRDVKSIQTIRPVLPSPILTNIVASAGLPPSGHVPTPKITTLPNVFDAGTHAQALSGAHVQPISVAQTSFNKPSGLIQISATTAAMSAAMPLAIHSLRASNTVFASQLPRDGSAVAKPNPVLTTTMIRPVNQATVQLGIPHLPSVIHQTMQQPRGAMITTVKPLGQTVITRPAAPTVRFAATTLVPATKTQIADLNRASMQHATTPTTNTIQITLQHQRDLTPKQPHPSPSSVPFAHPVAHKTQAKVIVSNSGVVGAVHGISGVATKTVSGTNITTLRPAISHMTTLSHIPNSATIPIAKVTPHRQQVPGTILPHAPEHSRPDPSGLTHGVPASGILMPQMQQQQRTLGRPLITSVAITPSNSLAAADQKVDRPTTLGPYQQPSGEYFVPYTQLNQLVYQQLSTAAGTPQQAAAYKTVSSQLKPQTTGLTQATMNTPTRYPAVVVSLDQPRAMQAQQHRASDAPLVTSDIQVPSSTQNITPNPSSSPRPTILRKRTNEGVIKKQLNLSSSIEAMYPRPGSAPLSTASSPKTPAMESRDSSQSSTDTALSNDASPPNTLVDVKIKQEPADSVDNGSSQQTTSSTTNVVEVSPRKKPRKQLLQANEELKDHASSDEDVKPTPIAVKPEPMEAAVKQEIREDYTDSEGIRWTVEKKRPSISLLNHYTCHWKPRNNHFTRHSDIKVKDERRPTVNELANQRRVNQKTNGWKFYYMSAQLEELLDDEDHAMQKMAEIQQTFSLKNTPNSNPEGEEDFGFLHEVCQGTLQRSQLVKDQVLEAKSSLLKILDHRTRIMEIINKHISKRPIKKKERS